MFYLTLAYLIGILFLYHRYMAVCLLITLIVIVYRKQVSKLITVGCLILPWVSGYYFHYQDLRHQQAYSAQLLHPELQGRATFTDQAMHSGSALRGHVSINDNSYSYHYFLKQPNKIPPLAPGTQCEVKGELKYLSDSPYSPQYFFIKDINLNSCQANSKASLSLIERHKNFIYQQISHTHLEHPGRIIALVSGDTSYLSEQEVSEVKNLGIYHLIAVSGSHIAIICSITYTLLLRLNVPLFYIKLTLLFLLPVYGLYTDLAPSALRSIFTVMLVILIPSRFYHHALDIVGASFILLTLIFPHFLFDIGFQFSYLITLFILLSQPLLDQTSVIKSLLYMTFIAQLGSFLISAIHFNEVQWIGLFANLIFVPFYSIVLFPLAIFYFAWLHLKIPLNILDYFINMMFNVHDYIVRWILQLSHFKWFIPQLNEMLLTSLLLVLLSILYFFVARRFITALTICISLFLILQFFPAHHVNRLTMLNVGQGDAFLIESKKGQTLMIDTGGKHLRPGEVDKHQISKYHILPTFKKRNITNIDYLIITHPHADHMGELDYLLTQIKVKHLILNPHSYTPQQLTHLTERLSQWKGNVIDFRQMPQLTFDEYQLQLLDATHDTSDDLNEHCIIILMQFRDKHLLFMGDATVTNEETLLQQYQLPPIDILKVGHHGSKTSSSQAFIDAIHPRVSLISAGKNNRYHLPNKEVEERLNDNQSAILTTVENGEITLDLETSIESMLKPWKIYEPLKSSE